MSKLIAIITLYYPSENNIENIDLIAKNADAVIVCDNSSMDNSKKIFNSKVRYMGNFKNCGLSAAFNNALKEKSINWNDDDLVIFFDQDSKIVENHIDKLISEYNKLISMGYKVGCIGPVYYDESSERCCIPKIKKNITNSLMAVSSIITSSMLCRYGDLKNIGFWNEEIFLDMADWDICWRFLQNGYLCCMTTDVCLLHKLGEGQKKIGPIKLKIAKPFREYYQTRDCLKLLQKSYTPLKYKLRFILMITVRPVLHLLFLDHRKDRAHYIFKGFKDFKNGVTGELK